MSLVLLLGTAASTVKINAAMFDLLTLSISAREASRSLFR
jgi:hypothetical protein